VGKSVQSHDVNDGLEGAGLNETLVVVGGESVETLGRRKAEGEGAGSYDRRGRIREGDRAEVRPRQLSRYEQ
jgi:hypothetical protein